MIRIAISTDSRGYSHNATLIASIVRRTRTPVEVRCWCRGFLPESFEMGHLKVEFISATEEVTGRYPGHVSTAVFDRLRVIRDSEDWDRCLILDHDMVCLSDLAEYFAEDFEGNLLMGRLFGEGNTVGLQMKARGGLPASQRHAEDYPFFFMGPMMNLALMREEGTWEKLLEAHAAIGEEEQISLTVATGGRTKGVAAKWNQVPQWDFPKDPNEGSGLGDPLRFEGIIHWTGWAKPWHPKTKVWRPDVWEGEKSTWEHLRMGLWAKPLALLVKPENDRGANALASRGWRVKVYRSASEDEGDLRFPDLDVAEASVGDFQRDSQTGYPVDQVHFSRCGDATEWLQGSVSLPRYLTIRGPIEMEPLGEIHRHGYVREVRLKVSEWPAGGPMPRALDFGPVGEQSRLNDDEEICLQREASDVSAPAVFEIGPIEQGDCLSPPPLLPAFALVISLENSGRLSNALKQIGRVCERVEVSPGVRVDPGGVLWRDIRGMEAYHRAAYFRSDYIPNALGCRLAGLAALERGLGGSEGLPGEDFLVFQDDVLIDDPAGFLEAVRSLPADADCLWLDTHQVTGKMEEVPGSPLRRLSGARLCTGFWICRRYAAELVERLRLADCEWDVFMEREMKTHVFYAPAKSVCRQRRGISEITGGRKW